ncbi:Uncharacterised protein [Streptococcus pneumoniae]|nr:Uncharacterised protein [Streptococcus pneumoniae]
MSGVTIISTAFGTAFRTCLSTTTISHAAKITANNPPRPGTSASPNNFTFAIAGLKIKIPAIAPRTGVPPNSFAVFQPTKMPKNVKIPPPISSNICSHVAFGSAPAFFAKLATPFIIPDATRPGINGMKILPIFLKKFFTGVLFFFLISDFISCPRSSR